MEDLTEFSYFQWLIEWRSIRSGILLAAAFIAIFGTMYLLLWRGARRRGRIVKAAAADLHFEFRKGHDPEANALYPQFRKTQTRLTRDGFHTARGHLRFRDHMCDARFGDFAFRFGKSDAINRRATGRDGLISYLIVRLPWAQIPEFILCPDGAPPDMLPLPMLRPPRIDFESDEFNRTFDVYSPSRRFAYDLVDPRMMSSFLRSSSPTVHLEGGWLLVTTGGQWLPRNFAAMFDWVQAFLDRWPDHLVQEFERPADSPLAGPRRY